MVSARNGVTAKCFVLLLDDTAGIHWLQHVLFEATQHDLLKHLVEGDNGWRGCKHESSLEAAKETRSKVGGAG